MQTTGLRGSAALAAVLAGIARFPWLLTNIGSSTYLPHGFCFRWNLRLLQLHVISDSLIWLSYTAIALMLAWLVVRVPSLTDFKGKFHFFGAFILLCGVTHLLDVAVLWQPLYWLQGDIKLLTACASLITAVALPYCVKQVRTVLEKAARSAENERRFVAAIESSLDGFYILESIRDQAGDIVDFRFVFANGAGGRILGCDSAQLAGQSLDEIIPENRTRGFFAK